MAAENGNETKLKITNKEKRILMGLFGSKINCALCSKLFSKKEGKVFVQDGKGGICRVCFDKWIAEGSQCTICHSSVHGTQEVSFFPEEKNIGHYDCGRGMRLR